MGKAKKKQQAGVGGAAKTEKALKALGLGKPKLKAVSASIHPYDT